MEIVSLSGQTKCKLQNFRVIRANENLDTLDPLLLSAQTKQRLV